MGIVEQLTHCNRRAGLLPEQFEISIVFRGERVLNKEWMILFQLLYEVYSHDGGDSFVDVMKQFNFLAAGASYMLEHLDSGSYISS